VTDEWDRRSGDHIVLAGPGPSEPWLSFFTPGQLSALLEANGLAVTGHARQRDAIPAALWRRSDALRPADLCRLARAAVPPRPHRAGVAVAQQTSTPGVRPAGPGGAGPVA